MYLIYEIINGVLCFKTTPKGEWQECSKEQITAKYLEVLDRLHGNE